MGKTRAPYPAVFRQQLIELVEARRTAAEHVGSRDRAP
jgi:hypothetical protein